MPSESIGTNVGGGAVNVIYGAAGGLSSAGNQFWNQNSAGISDGTEAGDSFGTALAAGDLNGDARADLAVGVPSESIGTTDAAGAVNVIYGAAGGLSSAGNQFWNQNSTDIADKKEAGDSFGVALAAGDLNADGPDDLAVGVPVESLGTNAGVGIVNVIYGSGGGLNSAGNQFWSQNSTDIADKAEPGDSFGVALAAGDLNGDARDDLAVGVPSEAVGTTAAAGAVNLIYGAAAGLSSTGNQFWNQNSAGISDVTEAGDSFGVALAAGDLNGDARDDLAVGVPSEAVGTTAAAGAVNLIYGAAAGLSSTGNQFWNQDSTNILDLVEASDKFGAALGAGPR